MGAPVANQKEDGQQADGRERGMEFRIPWLFPVPRWEGGQRQSGGICTPRKAVSDTFGDTVAVD